MALSLVPFGKWFFRAMLEMALDQVHLLTLCRFRYTKSVHFAVFIVFPFAAVRTVLKAMRI